MGLSKTSKYCKIFFLNGPAGTDDKILLPENIKLLPQNLKSLINTIYPEINIAGICDNKYFSERTILSSRNEDIDYINQEVLNIYSGNQHTYMSADSAVIEEVLLPYNNVDTTTTNVVYPEILLGT
ncbi:483_t:CDS:2 [Diversispora eburnea]|uniref:483_t:CDS:1 n=1 Tax=Diversispora eburnea TaxID=1213867 RepID=A0A9N9CJC8_9GLOM|nr:483_t:CDS:2 [Diversispora eburnea]